jgi:hypothetical protein
VLSTIGASHARFVEPRSKVVSKETNSLLNTPTSIFFFLFHLVSEVNWKGQAGTGTAMEPFLGSHRGYSLHIHHSEEKKKRVMFV